MSKVDAAAKLKALQAGQKSGGSSVEPEVDSNGVITDVSGRDYGGNDRVVDSRGVSLMKEAERKLKKFSLFADKNRNEKCLALYEEAAKCFRLNDDWQEAAEAFELAAELAEVKLQRPVEAASFYVRAASCHRHLDIFDAMKDYSLAVALNMNNNNLKGAANLWREIAELLLEENRIADALEAYQKCAACHEAEDTMVSAVQCYLSMAEIYLKNEDFDQAALLFAKAAEISIEKKINVGSHIEYIFKSLLCDFVMAARKFDVSEIQLKMKEHLKQNRRYEGTKEFELLKKTVKAFEAEDLKEFKKAVAAANKIKELDQETTLCLVQVQRALIDGPKEDDNYDPEEDQDLAFQ